MISGKKILRDLIIIAVITIAGVVVWIYSPKSAQKETVKNPMGGMMGNMSQPSGDGSSFDVDNNNPCIKINDQTFTVGQIDSQAKVFYTMMSGGSGGDLTVHLLNQARRETVKRFMQEIVLRDKASELGIVISPEQVETAFNERFEKMGGAAEVEKMMKSLGVTRDTMMRRVEKDLIENTVFESVTKDIKVPDNVNPEEYKSEEFYKWVESEMETLDVKILSPEMEEVFKISDPSSKPMPPHPFPDNEEKATESKTG